MRIAELLRLRPGVTAIIGGGGKTSLMYRLAEELPGRVLVCTSTRILPPPHLPLVTGTEPDLDQALETHRVVCAGTPAERGKLGASQVAFGALEALADWVLVEADGSKGLPLKAHLPHEPVIPPEANNVILVQGADGFGRPVSEVCHRPEVWAALAGCGLEDPVTPEALARVIRGEGLGHGIFVNKTETPETWAAARALGELTPLPVTAGSLWRKEYRCLY